MAYKILVVDDEVWITEILKKFLIRSGYEVEADSRGSNAVERFKNGETFDLMVLDEKMPEMRGIDVVKEITALGIKIPVVFLTGSISINNHLEEIESLGYREEDFMSKPADLNVLLEEIKKRLP